MADRPNVSLLTRLFVWSVVFDPLLLFVFADRSRLGITFALGRTLQVVVLALLALKLPLALLATRRPEGTVTPPPRFVWSKYAWFLALAVVAGLIGLRTGAYAVPRTLEFNASESRLAQTVNAVDFRPLVEYVIAAYYFVYFVILARGMLRTREHVDYFFRAFRLTLIWCLVIGFADVLAIRLIGFEGLPRHLGDGVLVGPRFHGLAGEPRHAFGYLFFALAVLHLEAYFHQRRVSRKLVFAILAAAIATQSGSGVVGIVCFAVMYGLNGLRTLRWSELVRVVVVLAAIGAVLLFAARSSVRISGYLDSTAGLWQALEAGDELPGLLAYQKPEIYPLYDFVKKAQARQWVPVLIGSGLGSASAVNNRLAVSGIEGLANPNSQLVRSLYESGLIGTALFVLAFLVPVRKWTEQLSWRDQRAFVAMVLLVVGCGFGVRGNTAYIYLGICAAVFEVMPASKSKEPQPA